MIFFTALIFIAELVIAVAIITTTVKFSHKINFINSQLLVYRHRIIEILNTAHKAVEDFSNIIKKTKRAFIKKRDKLIFDFIKTVTITIAIVILGKKYKKQAITLQLLLILYDSIKEGCVS